MDVTTLAEDLFKSIEYISENTTQKYDNIIVGTIAANGNRKLNRYDVKVNKVTYRNLYCQDTDLELNDNNQWTYKIEAKIARSVYHEGECITINSKIIKTDQTELIYLTRCYALPNSGNNNNYAYYQCTVMGDNQAQTDLVYVSTSTANEISIDWDGKLTDDEIISRKAELTLEKIYDMEYSSRSRDWTFKTDVSDDNNMPNNAVVWVVVKVFETTTETPITSYTTAPLIIMY